MASTRRATRSARSARRFICSAAAGAGPRPPLEPAHGKQPHPGPRESCQTRKNLTSSCWAAARRASSSPGRWRRRASGTHIGYDDFRVVYANLTGGNRVTTGRQTPFCLFTDPELARIGLSETEAKDRGIPYRLAKIPMDNVLRTRTLSETRGFLKALIERDGDRILGFTALGPAAGEVMAAVQVAMAAGLPYTALRDMVLTHPTMAEGLVALFSAVPAGR